MDYPASAKRTCLTTRVEGEPFIKTIKIKDVAAGDERGGVGIKLLTADEALGWV